MELTTEEKIDVINQHLKNLAYNEYNLSLTLKETQSLSKPSSINIDSLNGQIADLSAQKAVLQKELDSLSTTNK